MTNVFRTWENERGSKKENKENSELELTRSYIPEDVKGLVVSIVISNVSARDTLKASHLKMLTLCVGYWPKRSG